MVDPPPSPGIGEAPDPAGPPGMPRWVKVSGIIVIALILLFVVLRLTGLGDAHGPGRHGPGQGAPAGSQPGLVVGPGEGGGHDSSGSNH